MKQIVHTLYGKISIVFLFLLLLMAIIIAFLSVQASMNFVQEADQRMNRTLASDLAKELRPFYEDSLDIAGIDKRIHHLMVMNHRVEIYLLDHEGRILAFFADPRKKVESNIVDLEPVRQYLAAEDDAMIWGDDPRNSGTKKPFSVTPITIAQEESGYLYVILASEQYDTASEMIKGSYIIKTSAFSLLVIFLFVGITGLILFALLTKRFHKMTKAVEKFSAGDYSQRFEVQSNDEIGRLGRAFNKMADTIVASFEKLKHNDDLRRELIANVSHDLRSPLASMQGYLETIMIKDRQLTPQDRKKYLDIIFDNTTQLNNLVNELFELSKLDAKQVKPNIEPFMLPELAQDVVMKFKPKAEKLGVDLRATLPKKLPVVHADIALIERALSNLIDNALRYTPATGSVEVSVVKNGKSVKIVVADTGCGIPPEDIDHVFDRFYRVDKSRARDSGGTGLGLAIAKRIVELHDSRISVQSQVDAGTTLSFELAI